MCGGGCNPAGEGLRQPRLAGPRQAGEDGEAFGQERAAQAQNLGRADLQDVFVITQKPAA